MSHKIEVNFTRSAPDGVSPPAPLPSGEKAAQDPYCVQWDGPTDRENPRNWGVFYRWYITSVMGLIVLSASFASSAPAGVLEPLIQEFHLTHTLVILTISLFIAGYCVGPLFWGPLSEQYGRKPILVIAFLGYTGFQVGGALAKNTASVLVLRFLAGSFAASPFTVSGAVIGDIWDTDERGKAVAVFTVAPLAGPALGPIVVGYLTVAGVTWRWLFWILAIFAGACFIILTFSIPETYAPVIQSRKAARKRKETGDQRYHSQLEEADVPVMKRMENIFARPFKILAVEPMLIAMTLYLGFLYGAVYLCFEAYPVVYTQGHNLNTGESGLTFLPIFIGSCLAVVAYIYHFNPSYKRQMIVYAPRSVPPEKRLVPAFYGGPMLLALFNYIIDAYLNVSASALAFNTVVRSSFGAIFPLFSTQMYQKLNPRWASTVLAAIALIMVPIPFVLYRWGEWIRRTSRYAPTDD
ncbi:hypothetical protein FRB90_004368 [Tulasnella sp. 427]|nr:hypothetical protein FRB90_004368 [Tulasnella sp. 427]